MPGYQFIEIYPDRNTLGTRKPADRNLARFRRAVDKRVLGVRIAYDVLCEFLHPNVGDLYATTVRASSQTDIHGTRHLIREIDSGQRTYPRRPISNRY